MKEAIGLSIMITLLILMWSPEALGEMARKVVDGFHAVEVKP